jgi:ABC-type bacteriocin/lantibiotic exporter with double-glycine peptidase domain
MGAKYLGVGQHSLDEMARMVGWDPSVGTTLAGLETGCVTMGLRARSLHFREVSQLERVMRRSGALAIINDADHYYLIMKVSRNGVLLMSTTLKPEWIPARKLAGVWDGKALLFSRQPIRTGMGQTPMRLGACLAVLIAASMLTHRHLARRRLRRRSDLPE